MKDNPLHDSFLYILIVFLSVKVLNFIYGLKIADSIMYSKGFWGMAGVAREIKKKNLDFKRIDLLSPDNINYDFAIIQPLVYINYGDTFVYTDIRHDFYMLNGKLEFVGDKVLTKKQVSDIHLLLDIET